MTDHQEVAVEARRRQVGMVHLPLVCPHKDKANFCSVAGQLKSVPSAWNLTLDRASGIGGVATLEMMLRLMWPNPDRHQDGTPRRRPSQAEPAAGIQLAVRIIQRARRSALVRC